VRDEIFISYSHLDARYLSELRQFLVPFERQCGIAIWDDQRIQPGSAWEAEIKQALKRAKVAVLLVTVNFLASRFVTQSELPAILEDAAKGGVRILWVAVGPCDYEATEIAKYQSLNDPSNCLDSMPAPKRRVAWDKIAKKIKSIYEYGHAPKAENSVALSVARKSVLIAQVTDDIQDEADQLRSYLQQYGEDISVLPAGSYPQGGEAFMAAVDDDLARADLFVQLLGRRPGRVPPDLPEGYTRWQLERAKATGVQIMQWRHPEIDTKAIEDTTYKTILSAETVVASGLEAFKRQILNWARKPPPRHSTPRTSTVFINADERDLGIAKEVERECVANALTAILPMTGPTSEVIRKDLAENLIDCDVLVFIYGDTTQDWIRSQLRFFNKVRPKRESAPRLLAICSGPPPKPDIGMSFPGAHLIDCPDGWNLEPIRNMISEFSA